MLKRQPENEKAHYDDIVKRIGQQLESLRQTEAPEGEVAADLRMKQIEDYTKEFDHLKGKLDANDDMARTGKALNDLSVKISRLQQEAAVPVENNPAVAAGPEASIARPPAAPVKATGAVGKETRTPSSPVNSPLPTSGVNTPR